MLSFAYLIVNKNTLCSLKRKPYYGYGNWLNKLKFTALAVIA